MILDMAEKILKVETEEGTKAIFKESYTKAKKMKIDKIDKHINFNQFDLIFFSIKINLHVSSNKKAG